MALTPTLFVGLGSTGSHILKKLREYIHATYLTRDLSIFQFLVIETAPEEGEGSTDESWRFFRGEPCDFNSRGTEDYDWLRITDSLKAQKFDAGSANVRIAGRLYLWQNWVEPEGVPAPEKRVKSMIDEAFNAMKLDDNTEAIKYLETYYLERRGISREDLPKPIVETSSRVFIVGTFCGGTASGMLWDICYYLREKIYGSSMAGPGKKLQGIFTMPDINFANRGGELYPEHAANTWAALHELDYWSRPTTNYQVSFPDQVMPIETTQPPFDHFHVVSPSTNSGQIDSNDPIAALDEVVALYLFCQTVDQFQGKIQAKHVDWPLANGLHPQSKRLRFLSTFGLSGVLFPKYNIAATAACLLGSKVCEKWKNQPEAMERAVIEDYAATQWDRLFKDIDSSDRSTGKTTLDEARELVGMEIERVDFGKPNWDTSLESSVEMESRNSRRRLESKVNDWRSDLKSRVARMVTEAFDHYGNIPQTDMFIESLIRKISEDLSNLNRFPEEEPQLPSIASLLKPAVAASSNFWVKLAGKQEKAIGFHRSRALRIYREELEDFVRALANHLAKTAVEDLRDKTLPSLRSRLNDELLSVTEKVAGTLQNMLNDYTNFVTPPSVRLVTSANPDDEKQGIEAAAQELCESLSSTAISDTVSFAPILTSRFSQFDTREFERFAAKEAAIELRERFLDQCIDYLDEKSNLAVLIQRLGPDSIKAIENAAEPYIEWASSSISGAHAFPCLFGNRASNDAILHLTRGGANRERVDDTVDHMGLFYNETFGFAIDDTAVSVNLKKQFENQQEKQSMYSAGRFTHKDRLDFFDTGHAERQERMEKMFTEVDKWATVAIDIMPEAFHQDDGLFFTFTNKGIIDEVNLTDPEDCRRLVNAQEGFDEFIANVKKAVRELGRVEANNRVNACTTVLRDKDQRQEAKEKGDFYRNLFDEVFPAENGTNTSPS